MADPPVGWECSDRCADPDKHGHDPSLHAPGSHTPTGGICHDEKIGIQTEASQDVARGRSTCQEATNCGFSLGCVLPNLSPMRRRSLARRLGVPR